MKRIVKLLACLLFAAFVFAAFAGCSGSGRAEGLSKEEEARAIELARAFRIFGEYDSEKGFEIRQYEYLVFSMATWALEESEVRDYGRLSFEEADALVAGVIGTSPSGVFRTKYDPTEIQVIYAVGDNYYVMLTDDSAYSYSVDSVRPLTDENGERTGCSVNVKVTGGDSDFSVVFELACSESSIFTVKKCEIHNSI